MEIEIKLKETYHGAFKDALNKLNQLELYNSWWPFESKILNDKTLKTAIPELCSHIIIEKLETIHQNVVAFKFKKGFFRGTCVWIFKPSLPSHACFVVTHFAYIRGVNAAVSEMTTLYPFREVYKKYIEQIWLAAGFKKHDLQHSKSSIIENDFSFISRYPSVRMTSAGV